MEEKDELKTEANTDLVISIIVCSIVVLVLTPNVGPTIVSPRLLDGSLTELGRYAFTFDAYDTIRDDDGTSIIFLGSSKMREAINGLDIENQTISDINVYNLAYAGERPYFRMIEIDALIQTSPDIVVLELGPSSFSPVIHDDPTHPLASDLFGRLEQLVALSGTPISDASYYPILINHDRENLPDSNFDVQSFWASRTPEAIELTISFELNLDDPPHDCFGIDANVRCVPAPSEASYSDYLRYPTQFPDWFSQKRISGTLDDYYSMKIPNYINSSLHSVEGRYNNNHIALDFIIDTLQSNGIVVVLLAIPYYPIVQSRIPVGHWDYVNQSMETYAQDPNLILLDWFWEDWGEDHFVDLSHMNTAGEIEVARRISPVIDDLLIGGQL
jgi:hypothetical protein